MLSRDISTYLSLCGSVYSSRCFQLGYYIGGMYEWGKKGKGEGQGRAWTCWFTAGLDCRDMQKMKRAVSVVVAHAFLEQH